ncbi:hypothetical protein K402DRAFT_381476 [Aulographum hederae CBS 113979]|uniref:Aminoglycoside phosphotransferase domain-containing protein n=1 Tax=Aulographum hederae CBS 113979 TaxID=1176131 RepID=A0A6G1GTX8_9PEZI|nr:hypothetical protein K402DRAFT_381476 [Aulographum hederae CBS 113979]
MDVRKWGEDHINESLKQVDASNWVLGSWILQRLPCPSDSATWNDPADGSSYTVTEMTTPPLQTQPVDSPHIKLVYEAGDFSAVWSIGSNAFFKAKYMVPGATLESTTLEYVQKQHLSCFKIPKVLFHTPSGDRSFLFVERIPGRTLDSAWTGLSESWRQRYVDAIVQACVEMSHWRGTKIGGVDGLHLDGYYLAPKNANFDCIEDSCKEIGMDCSDLVFHHTDLGPTNIIVEDEPSSGETGIIDFETAGFLPRGWIRTKFRLSAGMDLTTFKPSIAWRLAVQLALGANGFSEHVDGWLEWRKTRKPYSLATKSTVWHTNSERTNNELVTKYSFESD